MIPLNFSSCDGFDTRDVEEREYLIFGGVHGDFTEQTFIWVENMKDIT